ncbi:PLP-dependent decarboxylase [bacterium]|nr:PLP-dependent decarboxylase [bacterium]
MISQETFEKIHNSERSSAFVYDMDAFDAHLKSLTKALPDRIKTYYATKSNPLSSIVKCVYQNGLGIDVASLGELNQALTCEVDPKDILVTGPAKSRKKLKIFLEKGVEFYVIESLNQLHDLNELASEFDFTPRVLLRVQLTWPNAGESVLGGNDITAFGLGKDVWTQLDIKEFSSLMFEGFHVFQWGNVLCPDELESIWRVISKECLKLAKNMGIAPKIIDFGGGWGIPYEDEKSLDLNAIAKALENILNLHQFEQIYIELGRYAIGEYGYYFSEVVDRKIVRGQELLVLDGGMNHLIRPALTNQSFPLKLLRNSKKDVISYQIHGPLCSSLDTIGKHDLPNDIAIGDVILFSQCGAYGFTESMPFFLCHEIAAEVIVSNEEIKVMRETVDASWWLV